MAESTTNELQAAAAAVRALRIERAAARRFLRTRHERESTHPCLAPCSEAAERDEIARIELRLEEAEAAVEECSRKMLEELEEDDEGSPPWWEHVDVTWRTKSMSIERAVAFLTALADEDGNAREADRTPLSVASTELEAARTVTKACEAWVLQLARTELEAARTVTLACEAWVLQLARRACTDSSSDAARRQERRGGRLLETRDEARRALKAMDAADRLRADAASRLGRAEREAEEHDN